jgi:hypothetical protein
MANPTPEPAEQSVAETSGLGELSDGTRILRRSPRMRACGLKDAKGKICAGHLKRWYFFGDEIKARFGEQAEIYRCENCGTLYLPCEQETPRSPILSY